MADDKDGDYCTICGGMVPKGSDVVIITVDGKEVGINRLAFIIREVADHRPEGVAAIKDALLARVKALNYVPTKKEAAYADAVYAEYLKYLKKVE
ncbi:hypothetical protein AZH53_07925 [Methanomicrobiaceae archaeon CYW5]|uniref:NAC family transcription factor n=1 Tax=Methanovulcanius yangii TaxID=1789227 RepID=UPI0029CA301D|nr:NAC family transcription factor [Methanovulcanius yangii]MBT8508331.1 hypothetical protein [Methanovulcanius yangii]